jgi:hypothetical protein
LKALLLGLGLSLAAVLAHGQRGPDPAPAQTYERSMPRPEEMRRLMGQPDEAALLSHRHYRARTGQEVHSPARTTDDQAPATASAKCRDGSYSFSQHRRGTCSHHGGVQSWL